MPDAILPALNEAAATPWVLARMLKGHRPIVVVEYTARSGRSKVTGTVGGTVTGTVGGTVRAVQDMGRILREIR
jgi:hypothetical protein